MLLENGCIAVAEGANKQNASRVAKAMDAMASSDPFAARSTWYPRSLEEYGTSGKWDAEDL